jgi:hypothetical protein
MPQFLSPHPSGTALSRFKWLFVIARNSSFTFKGKAVDVKEVGRRLGVRYVLQGSVRKANIWSLFVGLAKFWQGANPEAIVWLRRSLEANRNHPNAHFYLAAALALVGELDEARPTAQAGLALNPSFTIRRYRTNSPSNHPVYLAGRERFIDALRMAGVMISSTMPSAKYSCLGSSLMFSNGIREGSDHRTVD